MATKRFLGLDGLRGICALSVLLYHSTNFFSKGTLLPHGFLAVDVFFMMSGFVIALTYEEKLASGDYTLEFLSNRAHRLFPTYWLGAALNIAAFLVVASAGGLFSRDSWFMIWVFIPLTTFLMIPDYITPDGFLYPGMEGVTWSLFLEWIAYGTYASGVFRWRTPALAMVAVCGWVLMTVAGYFTDAGWCPGGDRSTLFTIGILRCIPAFAAGVVIYRIHRHEIFNRLPIVPTGILLAIWLGLAALPMRAPTPTLDAIIVVVFCPALIALLIRSDHKAPAFCRRLGELSYPLYVAHPGILLLAHFTGFFGLLNGPRPLNGLMVVGLCIAFAWGIMEIDARLRRARKVRAAARDAANPRGRTYAMSPGPERRPAVSSADTLQLN